ncbi:MAG: type II toxin-antitoxin system RelE/ParE family toxin [candidate division NC10 bacterium]
MTIVVAPQARRDLNDAYDSIARDNPAAADLVLARLVEVFGLLATDTFVGPEIVLRDGRRVRSWPVPPYRIYYRRRGDLFEIVRVYHQGRRPIERY